MTISLIVAVAENNGIGLNNALPWGHNPEDMKWFKANTAGKVVVMGSSTWDSLPLRPLPKRTNVVLSSRGSVPGADAVLNGQPQDIIKMLEDVYQDIEICIMGGAKVYQDFFPFVNRVYLTRIGHRVEADTFLDVDRLMNEQSEDIQSFKLKSSQVFFEPMHTTFEIWEK